MTWRAIILGIAGGVLIAGFGYLNDSIFRLNFIVGNHFPISVFGVLAVFSLAVNPLLRRWWPRAELRASELVVIVALTLVGCSIPGSGLMREFSQIMAMPAHFERVTPSWRQTRALSYAPPELLLNDGRYEEDTTAAYVTGSKDSRRLLDARTVPWWAWLRPLAAWVPIIVLTAVATICLSLIVHPQWSRRELLPYPIVAFAHAIISGRAPGSGQVLVRSRGFWLGLLAVFAVRSLNGLCVYYPDYLFWVPLEFDFTPLVRLCPEVTRGGHWWWLFYVRFYPAVIAFAFFLSSDVSLSLGLTQVVAVPVLAVLATYGIDAQAGQMGTGVLSWQMFGSGLALALTILYIGRHHYGRVVWAALVPRWRRGPAAAVAAEPGATPAAGAAGGGPETSGVWALRVLLLTVLALVALLAALGLEWPFAVLTVGLMLMMFVVIARVSAEAGLIHIETSWNALGVLLGLFGVAALGPGATVLVGLVCAMLMVDVREAVMPFVTNGLKMADDERVNPGRLAPWAGIVFVAGLALAIPVTLTAVYTNGVPIWDGWGSYAVPQFAFDRTSAAVTRLEAVGLLDQARNLAPLERLRHLQPEPAFLWAAGVGVGLVLLTSLLRLRLSWWPLHPVMFVTWSTWPLLNFCHSFLLGWLLKKAITRFGGLGLYRRALPLLIGVIAGDILAGLVFMAIGALYHAATGTPAPWYRVFPG